MNCLTNCFFIFDFHPDQEQHVSLTMNAPLNLSCQLTIQNPAHCHFQVQSFYIIVINIHQQTNINRQKLSFTSILTSWLSASLPEGTRLPKLTEFNTFLKLKALYEFKNYYRFPVKTATTKYCRYWIQDWKKIKLIEIWQSIGQWVKWKKNCMPTKTDRTLNFSRKWPRLFSTSTGLKEDSNKAGYPLPNCADK